MEKRTAFIPIDSAAVRLGVPAAWLRAEAEAARVPVLRAGKRLLVDVAEVQKVLIARAATEQREGIHVG
jgi:hypothetical protein